MTILCYHSVEPNWDSPLALPPDVFEEQCAWLARHRAVLPAHVAVEKMIGWRRLPRRSVAITFDDAFASLYGDARRILQRYSMPATIFIVARTLSPDGYAVDWVDTPPSFAMKTLTLDQVLEMQDEGFDFGSHTLTHRDLRELSDDECERDLVESKQMLEDLLRRPIPLLAYPRGFHNERVQRCAERAGYSCAFALPTTHEVPGRYAVPRAGVWPGNGIRALAVKTNPWYVTARTSPALAPLRRIVGS
jgi:peptidoglycan/xylan/chitin deacetylase (PgdA/CDA1 family)